MTIIIGYIAVGLVALAFFVSGEEFIKPKQDDFMYLVKFWTVRLFGVMVVVALWPLFPLVFILSPIVEFFKTKPAEEELTIPEHVLSKEDLIEKLSIEEIEKRELVFDPMNAVPNVPFGHCNAAWVKFKAEYMTEYKDEIWSYQYGAVKGYAIIRFGKVATHILTEI